MRVVFLESLEILCNSESGRSLTRHFLVKSS